MVLIRLIPPPPRVLTGWHPSFFTLTLPNWQVIPLFSTVPPLSFHCPRTRHLLSGPLSRHPAASKPLRGTSCPGSESWRALSLQPGEVKLGASSVLVTPHAGKLHVADRSAGPKWSQPVTFSCLPTRPSPITRLKLQLLFFLNQISWCHSHKNIFLALWLKELK